MKLLNEIEAAIAEDELIHPVSGGPNREHWRDVLKRHGPTRWPNIDDGYDAPTCVGCGRDDQGDPRYLVPCPEVLALARRLGIEVSP